MIILSYRPSLQKLKIFRNVKDSDKLRESLFLNRGVPYEDLILYKLDYAPELDSYTQFKISDDKLEIIHYEYYTENKEVIGDWKNAYYSDKSSFTEEELQNAELNIENLGNEEFEQIEIEDKPYVEKETVKEEIITQTISIVKL